MICDQIYSIFKTKFTSRHLIDYGALTVGPHTYGIPLLVDFDHGGKVIIGDYCSIGQNVYFVTANHALDLVTTHPFKSLENFIQISLCQFSMTMFFLNLLL